MGSLTQYTRRERELRSLLRLQQDGCYNLREFIASHGAELGLDADDINWPDEVLAPRLHVAVERRRDDGERRVAVAALSTQHALFEGAQWSDSGVVVPVRPLFRLASLIAGRKYIRFIGDGLDVTVPRQLVYRAAGAMKPFSDVSAYVDERGIHLRWDGRGGLNINALPNRPGGASFVTLLPSRSPPATSLAACAHPLPELRVSS